MKPVAFDIETTLIDPFDIETTLIDPPEGSYLDPTEARVAEVAFWSKDPDVAEVFSLRGSSEPDDVAERRLLEAVAAQVVGFGNVTLVGWNSSGFDLPFLAVRYAALGIAELGPDIFDTGLPGKYRGTAYDGRWAEAGHYDVWKDWAAFAAENGVRCSLKPLAEFVGLKPAKLDASKIDAYTSAQIREYVLSDVRCTYELYLRRPAQRTPNNKDAT